MWLKLKLTLKGDLCVVSVRTFFVNFSMAPATLDEVLQKYYLEVRKQDGSQYEPDSLKVMQAALERNLSTQKYPYSLINSL